MGTVFISYSWSSTPEHDDRVLALANQLRKNGLDCNIDKYETSPAEGWPKWMDRQIEKAEHVIVICTEDYWQKVIDETLPGAGKGIKWESLLIYQHVYQNNSHNSRFIPVVFDPKDCSFIPTPLKAATVYCLSSPGGYESLYRSLTQQPEVKKPELGPILILPPKDVALNFPAPTPPPSTDNISLDRLPSTGAHLFGREKELTLLDAAWADNNTHIFSLVAWGGVGKTALVNQWLNQMERDHYRGAQKIFGWSFYSQGATEGKQVSADEFFMETLLWFGDADPQAGSAVDKGRRLARLVRQHKCLLILDGLEPLQYPPNEVKGLDGKLKDQGLAALLKELALGGGSQGGLCVISTREPITDLKQRLNYGHQEIPLEHLSTEAGVLLLKSLGVTLGAPLDFQKAVTEYGGHALALTLLGLYIKNMHQGDIRRRDKIRQLNQLKKHEAFHAQHVMVAYERWFGESVERDILLLMGLFDRPVTEEVLAELLKEPVLPGVTEHVVGIGEEDFQSALTHLRDVSLLGAEAGHKTGTLDCHPLVREHFGAKLCETNPDGWQKAHLRLYHYFKNLPKKEFPDTLQEMEPLFAAVAHGCKAGLHQDVMDKVFRKRIHRGEEHYGLKNLSAFGSDLAALSHFFIMPWSQPVSNLCSNSIFEPL